MTAVKAVRASVVPESVMPSFLGKRLQTVPGFRFQFSSWAILDMVRHMANLLRHCGTGMGWPAIRNEQRSCHSENPSSKQAFLESPFSLLKRLLSHHRETLGPSLVS